jgi:hypothetical protein
VTVSKSVLLGRGRQIREIPQNLWEAHLAQAPAHAKQRLAFMSGEHHQVRNFVVRDLPVHGQPLSPERISDAVGLSLRRTVEILDELERGLFFLVRDGQGAVIWAFPVTARPTPHRLTFGSGEQIFAA